MIDRDARSALRERRSVSNGIRDVDPTAALITIHLLQFFFFSILLLQSIHFSSRFFLLFSEERLCVSVDSAFLFLCTTKSGRLGPPRDIYSSKGRHRFNTFTELYSPTHCLFVFFLKKKNLPPLTKKKQKQKLLGSGGQKAGTTPTANGLLSLSVFPLFLLGALSLFCECRIYTSERKCPFHVVFDINGVRAPTEVSYFRVDLGKPPTGLVSLSLILWPRKPRVNFSGIGGSQQVSGEYMAERDTTTTSGYTCLCNFFFVFLLFLVIREC